MLLALAALRAADLTGAKLTRRRSRQGPRAGDPVAALAYLPLAAIRSLLGMTLLLPLGLLVAAAAAAITFIAVPDHPLGRAGAYAAGALVACCSLGPGSERSRRPLSSFFGAITRTGPSTTLVFVGVLALAAGVAAAALSLPPAYWPFTHLTDHLRHVSVFGWAIHGLRSDLLTLARKLGM
jgi:hypothetical protein